MFRNKHLSMKAYKTSSVITSSKQVILSDIPFGVGEKVEVVVSRPINGSRSDRVRKLKALFKTTQSLSQIRDLTDADISREVAAHRNAK